MKAWILTSFLVTACMVTVARYAAAQLEFERLEEGGTGEATRFYESNGLLFADYSPSRRSVPTVTVCARRTKLGILEAEGFDANGKHFVTRSNPVF